MPSLENLRINPTGNKNFVYPAAEVPPALAVPNGNRTTDFPLTTNDIVEALGFVPAPLDSAVLTGRPTAPTPLLSDNSTTLATTAFVLNLVSVITGGPIDFSGSSPVTSVFGRIGNIVLSASDVTSALGFSVAPLSSPAFVGSPTAPTVTVSDSTTKLATTAFVQNLISSSNGILHSATVGSGLSLTGNVLRANVTAVFGRTGTIGLTTGDIVGALSFTPASLLSPAFLGVPTAPTQDATDSSTALATTAFVQGLFASASHNLNIQQIGPGLTLTSGVLTVAVPSVFGRTGAVVLTSADVTSALSFLPAPTVSPVFSGNPTGPTPNSGDNSNTLATTAFVIGAISTITGAPTGTGAVTSVFGRIGAVVLTGADVTRALNFLPAPTISPVFSGNPTGPTPNSGDNSNTLATTAFVANALGTISLVQSIGNGLSLTSGVLAAQVINVFGRTGAVVLTSADVTTALTFSPASLVSPSFTGTPTAPTQVISDNSTKLATTGFVQSAISGSVQTIGLRAVGGQTTTALSTRFGRTLSLIDDFGAKGDGSTDDTNAVNAWIVAVLATGAIGLAPTGTYNINHPLIIDWASVATTGAMFIGTGSSRCVINCSAVTSPAFLLTNLASQTSSSGKILGIGFVGSLPGVVLQIGQTDNSTPFANFSFDIAITNTNSTSASCCLEVHDLSDSTATIIAACAGHGNVLRIAQASNCTFMGRFGNADTGIYLTGGNVTSNVFQAINVGTVNTCVKIDSSSAKNNTFIGGQLDWDSGSGTPIAAINATAGLHNRFLNVYFPSTGSMVTGATGINIDGTPYSTLTSGDLTASGTTSLSAIVSAALVASPSYATDLAAETGGVPLGGFYRNGNIVQIRVQGATLTGTVNEVGVAVDSITARIITIGVTGETLVAVSITAILPLVASVSTTGNAVDTSSATRVLGNTITETETATDAVDSL